MNIVLALRSVHSAFGVCVRRLRSAFGANQRSSGVPAAPPSPLPAFGWHFRCTPT
jgi:hypothetical protein